MQPITMNKKISKKLPNFIFLPHNAWNQFKERNKKPFSPDNAIKINTTIFMISKNFTPLGMEIERRLKPCLKPELVY